MSELNEDSTFFKNIETNATICTNCYRKLKSYTEPHKNLPNSATALVEYEDHVNHYWVDDSENSGHPSVKRAACECGDMDGAKIRPLDNRQIMIIAQRIFFHLQEMEFEIREDIFFGHIRDNRDGSDIHFNEEKYLEEAIEKSLVTNDE